MRKLVVYIFLYSSLISCQKILFNDDVNTRELKFEKFSAVRLTGIFNIVLIQDSLDKVVLTGENNIYSIEASIKNDTLHIADSKKMHFNPSRTTLAIHFTSIDFLFTYDPVNVTNTDTIKADLFEFTTLGEIAEINLVVKCNRLIVQISSNTLGNFIFSGKTESCELYNRYGSFIYTDRLICKSAYILNESIGDVYVNASDKIEAHIMGKGNIYYYGNPVIDNPEKRGSGSIIKKGS